MMAKSITEAQIRLIATNSNSSAVTAAYSQLGPISTYTDLLDASNPKDQVVCLAAEQVIHMAESWRYLSSAMYAYLNNESGNAIHLAYYAQLRAALSLFSGAGIRIKLKDAYWINGTVIEKIPDHRTHPLVWKIWDIWRSRADARDLIENNIYIQAGVSLKHFETKLTQFTPGVLLGEWGYDLLSLKDDHTARNTASYNAYWGSTPLNRMSTVQLAFVKELAELLLSSGSGLQFDRSLIQHAVHQTIESILDPLNPASHSADRVNKLDEIADFVSKQSGADKDQLLRALSDTTGRTIFYDASQQSSRVENVMSRAAFLARLAMLSVKKNIAASGNNHAKNWLVNWLEHCGTWDPTLGIAINDIETDLSDAINNFPIGSSSIPADLWNMNNVFHTSKIANLHACIAWGVAA